jgi:hypothetical protein
MASTGDDLTRKAYEDLMYAADEYDKESRQRGAEAKSLFLLAGVEQGKADGLKEKASDAREKAKQLQSR